nr:Chain B, NleG8 peptide [Escherichia coli O157:H7 str. Sakai]
LATQNICTRI